MILKDTYKLYNGVEIPKIGLGTWLIDNDNVASAVKSAIELGYRHIDTSQAYQNEEGVGDGIRTSKIARKDLFVTTKLAAEVKSYKEAVESIESSLKRLKLDYLDLMIIHSPKPWQKFKSEERIFEGNREAWRALEEAYQAGKLKAIGLSNFEKEDLDNILESGTVKPMVNQILAHVSNTPFELIDYVQSKDILVEAYSPIGHGELLKIDDLMDMANKYNVSVPQLAIRYCLKLGLLPLPKSTNTDHIQSNAEVDFTISEEDLETLKNMDKIDDYGEASIFPVYQ